MAKKVQRIHRPRMQTPQQHAAEQALRERFQRDKPTLQRLLQEGDVTQTFTMGSIGSCAKPLQS